MRVFAHFALTVLVSFILSACAPTAAQQPQAQGNRIVYGLTLAPSGFDPHRNESSEMGIVLRQVYDTLVYRDPESGSFVPGLAAELPTLSEDRLTYTFTLRQDVRFHDGTPFNAQAVAATLDRITNPEIGGAKARGLLGSYTGYEIIDDYTIALRFAAPFSPLLDSLSQFYLGIASPTALNAVSPERYQFNQVGTGPFQFVEYIPNSHLIIRRNPDYTWGPAFYQPPTEGAIDEVEFRFFTEPSTRLTALESGDAQIMGELLPLDARSITGSSNIQLLPTRVPGLPLQFIFNTQRAPTDDLAVRQALLYATNRRLIVDNVFQGYSSVAWGPLTPGTQFHIDSLQESYDYNVQQARALLTTANYQDSDGNGYLNVAGETPEGTSTDLEIIVIVPPWGLTPQVAELMQDQWQEIGIRAVLQNVPDVPTMVDIVERGDYHLVAFNAFGIDPSLLNAFYMTNDGVNGTRNWTGFADPALDASLLEGLRQVDAGVRGSIYAQVQITIMEQVLILPIRDYYNLNAASSAIQGLQYDPYGWYPLLYNVAYVP